MKRGAERTCIGCRGVFKKGEVVRMAACPTGIAIDYREKLPGRGAYVCPKPDCIKKALVRGNIERALRVKAAVQGADEYVLRLADAIREKIRSLLLMGAKAGKISMGYSAVKDGLEKGRIAVVLFATDASEGSRDKLTAAGNPYIILQESCFTKDELGRMFGREEIGIVGIEDTGFADAMKKEAARLKSLINGDR